MPTVPLTASSALQWFVVKQKLVLIFEQVRDFLFISLFSDTTFTAVSGHKLDGPR